jgi:hypothetical protein
MSRFAVITYTTSKYNDVWPMHFGQLDRHLCGAKSYAFSDEESRKLWTHDNHELITYNNSDPYWTQYTKCLESVKEDYVIYSQEDFILFSDILADKIEKYADFLNTSSYDYVRLIRCGYQMPLDRHVVDDLYEVHMESRDAFSMQATLWKKDSLRKLYEHVKSQKWLESEEWNNGARELGIKGTMIYNGEPKVARSAHYDSIVYPYVCTAINKGKWNVDQYPEVMRSMFLTYNINPAVRGIRIR